MTINCILFVILFGITFVILFGIFFLYKKNYTTHNSFNFGELKHEKINLRYILDFISRDECEHLISIAKDGLSRSKIIGESEEYSDNTRTSYSFYFNKSHDDIITKIENRISDMVGKPINTIEAMQVVRYEDGQEFKEHYDWFQDAHCDKIKNQRQYTFFVYLNDVENGGETVFPNINTSFNPKIGDAIFWENCKSRYECHTEALHQGKAPIGCTKYGLNIWVNFNELI